ncbi:hypothetical protein BBP40_002293 [Aspergillus hancockii]|nr:hypothetical protein BBP40_002293 [Aspergillus hancockii]
MRFLFTRLDNQVVELLGTSLYRTLNQDCSQTPSVQAQFQPDLTTNDVYHCLDGILNHILYDRLDMALNKEGYIFSILPLDQKRTSRYLEEWHRGFMMSYPSYEPGVPSVALDSYGHDPDIMRMWYMLGKMYVTIRPDELSEDAWNRYMIEFETIVSLAEKYLHRTRQHPRRRMFSFALGIIPPLYVAGVQCRDMCIRRRAIWLLENCERREILWDSKMAAGAIRRVVELEECPARVRVSGVTAILDDDDRVRLEFE